MAKFRWHRGSLKESLKTTIEIKNFKELCEKINERVNINCEEINIFHYEYDSRIKETVYIVTNEKSVFGFIDERLEKKI